MNELLDPFSVSDAAVADTSAMASIASEIRKDRSDMMLVCGERRSDCEDDRCSGDLLDGGAKAKTSWWAGIASSNVNMVVEIKAFTIVTG
jgi:hypothetical protein